MPPGTVELTVDELRAVQLEVLAHFDRLCRSHGLTYYLAYGTLLGAVRHGGYIPWDDDVDVMMPRADYDRLPDVFKTGASPHLSLGSPDTRAGWPFPYAKVSDDRTQVWEPLEEPLLLGVNLDVFPLDALPTGRVVRAVQAKVLRLLLWAVELRYLTAERAAEFHRPVAVGVAKPLLRRVSARTLVAAVTRTATYRSLSGRVGVRVGSFDWSVRLSALGSPSEVDFEDQHLPAPADAQAVLSTLYGDFLKLPPEAERTSHHAFTAAWRNEWSSLASHRWSQGDSNP